MDPVTGHHPTQKRKLETVPKLPRYSISLISHPSKVMLKVILNRPKPESEKVIADEQAGFRPGRSTVEQICNVRMLLEKYLQHQQELHHVFNLHRF
ncbi:endonuclease-reverse transcriptase [Elysia marginata]|uniref:Endonuclease-reverse transcriptase n=1 Tax=Elysia marginata TaxID=1093978 RepID=A0AAV4JU23_9GAST|nr:endonuclease-reverse transcriptase [Elysia marginata]